MNKGNKNIAAKKRINVNKGMTQNNKADFRKSRKDLKSIVSTESANKEIKVAKPISTKCVKRIIKTKYSFNATNTKEFWAILTKNSISAVGYMPLKKGELVKVTEYANDDNYATAKPLDGRVALVEKMSYESMKFDKITR